MMKVRNRLGFENTLKCGLYPIHSAKNTFNSYVLKQVLKLIYMSSNTQMSTRAPHHAIIIQDTFTGEYNYPVNFKCGISEQVYRVEIYFNVIHMYFPTSWAFITTTWKFNLLKT